MAASDHATFSASGAERWLNCPGSIKLSEKAPLQPESEYAREGTEAHACFEFLLKNHQRLGSALKQAAKTYPDDMVQHVLGAANWVLEQYHASHGAELLSEMKVDSSSFTCGGQFGTLDAAVIREFGRLTVIDYKHGAGVAVDPDGNPQLAYYALALSERYNHNFSEVETVIIQPRAFHESGETVRSVTMTMDELLSWRTKFLDGVRAAKAIAPPYKAGKWCRWCPAAVICPELKTNALKDARAVFSDETGLTSVPEPQSFQLPKLGTILDACERLEAWTAKVREHARHVLEQGQTIPGWKLVDKRGQRKWADAGRASSNARRIFGEKAFSKPELLSPAQLEKQCRGDKSVAKFVESETVTQSSGTTLVRDNDGRPATRKIEQVFSKLPKALQMPPKRKKSHGQ